MSSQESAGEAIARGVALFDAGAYWEAHEAWEGPWRVERDEAARIELQGLIQVAAAFHKLVSKADVAAARRILRRALAKLESLPASGGRIASAAFVTGVGRCLGALERGATPTAPRLGEGTPVATLPERGGAS